MAVLLPGGPALTTVFRAVRLRRNLEHATEKEAEGQGIVPEVQRTDLVSKKNHLLTIWPSRRETLDCSLDGFRVSQTCGRCFPILGLRTSLGADLASSLLLPGFFLRFPGAWLGIIISG